MFIKYSIKRKKGHITVEAAIFLPLFILAMLSLICLIRMIGIEENVMRVYTDEASGIAKEAYIAELKEVPEEIGIETISGVAHEAIFRIRLYERIQEEENRGVFDLRLMEFKYLYESSGVSGLISGNLSYKTKIPLPIGFKRVLEFEERLLFRGFIGADSNYKPMPYQKMETEEESEIVYVFPRAGERYHKPSCSVIKVCPKEVFLSPKIKNEFTPCRLCRPDQTSNGSKVYCFDKSGKAYHRGNCPLVDRYVIPMEKEEAIEKGYTPCKVCGG